MNTIKNLKGNTIMIWAFFTLFTNKMMSQEVQISKSDLLALTPYWKGERFADGRPKAPDSLLDRLKLVTLEEAWAVLRNENYKYNYEDGWQSINPDSVLVGRALTATFMPGRPDIQRIVEPRETSMLQTNLVPT